MWSRFKNLFQKGADDAPVTPEVAAVPVAAPAPASAVAPEPTPAVETVGDADEPPPVAQAAGATEEPPPPVAEPVADEAAGEDTFYETAEPAPAPVVTSGPFATAATPLPTAVPVDTAETFEPGTGPMSVAVAKQEEQSFLAMEPISDEPLSQTGELTLDTTDDAVSSGETLHPDPITGEPGAHPASVGVGALGAGAAGAAIGALAGPVGIVIGAAIGAIAGGLAGHEVAVADDEKAEETTGGLDPEATASTTDETGRPSSVAGSPEEPLTVFPGSDFGAPTIMASGIAAATGEIGSGFYPATALSSTGETAEAEDFAGGDDTEETVRKAAYYLHLDRQEAGRPADALADWYDAEREVERF